MLSNVTVDMLIRTAYRVQGFQMSGSPAWIKSDGYDIEAKAEGNPNMDQMRPLLQALLAERFKLNLHRETKDLPAYSLAVAKPGKLGPRLHQVSDGECEEPVTPRNPCGGFRLTGGLLKGFKTPINWQRS